MNIATTHKNTDFDALASTIAATVIYPDTVPVLPKSLNANVRAFLSIHKDLFDIRYSDEIELDDIQKIVVVDVNKWDRLDRFDALKDKKGLEIIIWDHHSDPTDIDAKEIFSDTIGATTTLMVHHIKEMGLELSPIQATLFLAGIYEDTGNLLFPSTTAKDAYAAAWLLEQKGDLQIIRTLLRPSYGEKQKSILFDMLKNASRHKINGYNISINKLDVDGHIANLSVVVHMYREILNVDAAFGVFTNPDQKKCMIIGRSSVEEIDIGSIMKPLGGGGHPGAGSALLKDKSINPEVIEQFIVDLIEGNQRSSVQVSDLMSFPVISVSSDTPMKEAAMILRQKGYTGLPVIDNGKLIGVISRRDFQKVRKNSQLNAPVKAFMSREVLTVKPGSSPMEVARMMVKHDIGRLPVIDNGNIIGIVTRSNVMHYFYDMLPD